MIESATLTLIMFAIVICALMPMAAAIFALTWMAQRLVRSSIERDEKANTAYATATQALLEVGQGTALSQMQETRRVRERVAAKSEFRDEVRHTGGPVSVDSWEREPDPAPRIARPLKG